MRKFVAVLAVPLQAGEIPGNVSARTMRGIDNGFDSMHFLHVQAASHHVKGPALRAFDMVEQDGR